ncbi:MAG: hypothetical protein BWK73_10280 [Thiothrix lacustris]|uniref:Uncharacterized protein n=1 Tax=Thiothrix lacustris TaxID=525917 RepID=A0A1Y1QUS6_9GAMM|nr:MAG: hypothetical protein BWK73_10280 [Thiothrix lacustris]
MQRYPYKHAAIFANEVAARNVMARIQQAQLPEQRCLLLTPALAANTEETALEQQERRHKMIQHALSGGVGGAMGAAVASLAATSLKVVAFATHPWLAGMMAMGYGGLVGSTGSALYTGLQSDAFVQAVDTALQNGHWVVIAHSALLETDQQISQILEQPFTEETYEEH